MTASQFSVKTPLRVGLIGTGYAAKLRAETFGADARVQLVAVAGNHPDQTAEFSRTHQVPAVSHWSEAIAAADLVVIATVNRDHGTIAQAALQAGKHVVVEYPLSLNLGEAEAIATLAQTQGLLLHVEHIELLSGIHQALVQSLPAIGTPFYVRYATINPQHPAPEKWTYHIDLFGFPLTGAVSRLHRLLDLFGPVATVFCQARYWSSEGFSLNTWTGLPGYYKACLCTAQLNFVSGLVAEVVYGKGETFWQASRTLEIQGSQGAIVFDGEDGKLIQGEQVQPLDAGSRRGLFAKDTQQVLAHLFEGTPLYLTPAASLYALRVADAARQSAETGQVIRVAH